jgi:hypothetical protein
MAVDLAKLLAGINALTSTVVLEAAFTRPANITAYAATQAMGTASATVLTFSGAAREARGSFIIIGGRLVKSSTNAAASGFRLWLFSASPATPPAADQAAYGQLWANGYVDFLTGLAGTDCMGFEGVLSRQPGIAVKLPAGQDFFAIPQSLGAYAPASAESFNFSLDVVQD